MLVVGLCICGGGRSFLIWSCLHTALLSIGVCLLRLAGAGPPRPVLAAGLLHQRLELLVHHLPQLGLVPVLLVEVDAPEHALLLVRLLHLVQEAERRGGRHPRVLIALRLAEVREVGGPVPGHEEVQQLSATQTWW